jgi:hypothetical protein
MELEAVNFILGAILFGGTPAAQGIAETHAIREQHPDSREIEAWTSRVLGTLIALQGDEHTGRELLEAARAIFTELGHKEALGVLPFSTAHLELRAGDPLAAERELREGLDVLQRMGERGRAGSLAAVLAGVLVDQERIDEAANYVDVAREALPVDDVTGQAMVKMSGARVLAFRGELDEAVRLATGAIALMDTTEEMLTMPDLLLRQADVLELAGRVEDAEAALHRAADAAARKGAVFEERRAKERLAALTASGA